MKLLARELLKFNMGNSVKNRNRMLSLFKPLALAVLIAIVLSKVHSASIPNTTLHGKCDHFMNAGGVVVSCSSYTEIPTNIAISETVWYLHMENGNNIDTLRNGSLIHSNLKSLEYLNLKFCGIRAVEPGAFTGSNLLIRVYLSNNLITVLNPEIFKDVPSLRVIRLDNNPINKIEDGKSFPNFTEFIRLDLSNCKIDNISANSFANLKSIQTLNLTGNNLKRLDWRVLQGKDNLTILNLKNNPWHCDCHLRFLMKTLKNIGLAKVFNNLKCSSAEIPKWEGYSWNQVPEDDMTCHPEINSLVFSSDLGDGERMTENETLHLGQEIYIDCKYSGFPKPEIQWFKDKKLIMGNTKESNVPALNLTNTEPRVEFLNLTTSVSQRLEQDYGAFRYEFRDVLVVHWIELQDKGTYTCAVVHNHVAAYKTVTFTEILIPSKVDGNTTFAMWNWMAIFMGFILLVFTATMTIIAWTKKGKQEKRGIIQVHNKQL